MKASNLFIALVLQVIIVAVFFIGLFMMATLFVPDLYHSYLDRAVVEPKNLAFYGLALCLVSIALFTVCLLATKDAYLHIQCTTQTEVTVRPKVIARYCAIFFRQICPKAKIGLEIIVDRANTICLICDFSRLSQKQHDLIMEAIQHNLAGNIRRDFGYSKDLRLALKVK